MMPAWPKEPQRWQCMHCAWVGPQPENWRCPTCGITGEMIEAEPDSLPGVTEHGDKGDN
jgi:hypothetical protein